MNPTTSYLKTAYLILCGIFAAVIAVCSYIILPLPFTPIPVNLGTLGVFLAGGVLGRKYGLLSVALYILIGIAGIPVFAGFQAGLGALAGPTGGYILGYLPAVFLSGIFAEKNPLAKRTAPYLLGMLTGLLICYALGTIWFSYLMEMNFAASLAVCVLPFLPADIIKAFLAAILVVRLKPLLHQSSF